jgi:hypothetical protein
VRFFHVFCAIARLPNTPNGCCNALIADRGRSTASVFDAPAAFFDD